MGMIGYLARWRASLSRMSVSRLTVISALVGSLMPLVAGLLVRTAFLILGEPVLPVSLILSLTPVWLMMAIAFLLCALPATMILQVACARHGKVTPFGWGLFLGLAITSLGLFSWKWWEDTHGVIEGLAMGFPILLPIIAVIYTLGALAGGGIGIAISHFVRVRRAP